MTAQGLSQGAGPSQAAGSISEPRFSSEALHARPSHRISPFLPEKLYNSQGPELRRSLFSLKQLFQVR